MADVAGRVMVRLGFKVNSGEAEAISESGDCLLRQAAIWRNGENSSGAMCPKSIK